MKKLISLGLATTLALGMSMPTFAAWGGGGAANPTPTPTATPTPTPTQNVGGNTGTDTGTTTPPPSGGLKDGKVSANLSGVTVPQSAKIDLTLPSNLNGTLVLNPYGLQYTDGIEESKNDKVITSGYKYIENKSGVPLNVVWEVTGSASSTDIKFEKKSPHEWTTTQAKAKTVYLPVMIQNVTANNATPKQANLKNDYGANPAAADLVYVSTTTQSNSKATNKLKVADDEFLAYGIATAGLDADNAKWWDPDAKGAWVSNGQYPTSTSTAPTAEADILKVDMTEPWTAADTVSVEFIFSFEIA